ncbi:unnamed protein product [Withania somnifera]
MGRGGNVGRKTNDRRKTGFTYRASDQSDEDYTVDDDEEFDESEDGYSSFVGDESEESLGECEDEEEESKSRKVKRALRPRASSRNRKGTVMPRKRKRKRVSYREDDEEDDGVEEDDEEFTPDCLNVEEEVPVTRGTNNSSKRRLRKGTVKDEDDEEFTPDCLNVEEEAPVTRGTNNSSKRRLRKDTVKDEDDEEFTPDCLNVEEEAPVTRGTNNSSKRRLHKGTVKDEDDEELTPDWLNVEEEAPVTRGTNNSRKRRLRKGTVKDEDDEEFTPDCLDEEEETPVTKWTNNSSKRRLRKDTVKDEDDEEFTPGCLDEEEEVPVTKRTNNSSKRRLRKDTVKDEVDEEFTPDCLDDNDDDDDDEEEELPVTGSPDSSSKRRFHKGAVKDEDDEEFTPDCLDEEEEEEVPVTDSSSKRRFHKGTVKDEDDEEFIPDCLDDEEEEEFPVTERMDSSSKRRFHKGTVKDEDDEEFTPDYLDDEEEEEFPVTEGMDNSSKRWLHKGTVKDEDDEEEEDEDDGLNPDGLHKDEDFPAAKGMKNSSRLRRHKGTANDDDEDDDDEFTPDSLDEEEDSPVTKGIKNSSKPRLYKGTNKDDDDEEFTPDDLNEEEEFPVREGIKYSSKLRLRNSTAREQKRNRNHKELKKITRKNPQRRRRLRRKARSENDEEFIDVDPIMKVKNKKNAGQRRKGKSRTVDSDSDFVASSGPSDQANDFCRSLVTAWRGSASLKKSPIKEAPRLQRKHPGRKAKEKVEELKSEAGKQICGICLSEEGKRTVRGTLNCCSHYFCFACIMEWSKVESRCPLCKQRFVTISKPARSDTGFDLRTVVIQVPARDQVYQPSEEELRGYLDPYENVLCTECQQGGMMLLCYFVISVIHPLPEGNWYCESCRPTALASSNPQNLNPAPDNRTSGNFSVGSPVANVRETFDLNEMYVPDTPLTEESGDFQSPRDGQVSSLASGIGAFTVSDRRRIQRQIHQLLNNRRRQLGNITGPLGAVSGNSLYGSQIARSRELATQPAVAQRAAPQNAFFQGRQPEINSRLSQNRNFVPESSSNLRRQLNLNGASTSSQSFFGELLESELQGTDANFSFGLGHQQLHPFSSRSNAGPDTSPCQFREIPLVYCLLIDGVAVLVGAFLQQDHERSWINATGGYC